MKTTRVERRKAKIAKRRKKIRRGGVVTTCKRKVREGDRASRAKRQDKKSSLFCDIGNNYEFRDVRM